MKNPFGHSRQVHIVSSFAELTSFKFKGEINAVSWFRNLEGDFKEIVHQLELKDNITEISVDDLKNLNLSDEGIRARNIILDDIQQLTELGASPSLNLLKHYERDDELDFISTDVYSYHVDRSPIETDTFLCTYYGASSDIVPNHDVTQKILIPEIRAKLYQLHDGTDTDFEKFLKEYYFDLHYELKPNAQPLNIGTGHLWRLAVDHPQQQAFPCVHRAPFENNEYRLLLIC